VRATKSENKQETGSYYVVDCIKLCPKVTQFGGVKEGGSGRVLGRTGLQPRHWHWHWTRRPGWGHKSSCRPSSMPSFASAGWRLEVLGLQGQKGHSL